MNDLGVHIYQMLVHIIENKLQPMIGELKDLGAFCRSIFVGHDMNPYPHCE